ncbi:MAG TPA: hypothetical protein VM529_15910 [Gemmata sp.]|nr:hypothetical protein [Gemmata sp.]
MGMKVDPKTLKALQAGGRVTAKVNATALGLVAALSSPPPDGCGENVFMDAVARLARAAGWKVLHVLKKRVAAKKAGAMDYHWETSVAYDGKGFPDLLLLKPGRLVVVETKVGRNKATPEQEEWLELFATVGEARLAYPKHWPEIVATLTA